MKQSATLVASVSLLIGILLMVHPSPAASAAPREQLDDFFRQATTVLSEASDASQARHEIRQLARLRFDVPGAARRVLEPEWSALSVVERDEFIQLFGDRLLWGYLSIVRGKLPRDRPPAIRLVGEDVGAGGHVALVRTMVEAKDGTDVRFDYVMMKGGANWLVHDVVVDGVSLIENYRAQVAHVLRASSYAGLVAGLRSEAAAGGPSSTRQAESRSAEGRPARDPPVQPAAPQKAEAP
jgi:phospholipid transport system substrate-binding protein